MTGFDAEAADYGTADVERERGLYASDTTSLIR